MCMTGYQMRRRTTMVATRIAAVQSIIMKYMVPSANIGRPRCREHRKEYADSRFSAVEGGNLCDCQKLLRFRRRLDEAWSSWTGRPI